LVRERTRERGKRLYTAAEIRKLVDAAEPHLAAMILLGINCAFGPQDCCTLPTDAVHGGWHDYARPKTGVDRRCPLWPETVAAIKQVAGHRHVFNGRVWTRHIVARQFEKLCEACEVRNFGHYSLRRTFETIATTASVSQAVIDHIMGHSRNDMASVYRQQIFDQQLRACSEHVRQWYLGNLSLT
jgi:integrase